MNHHHSSRGVNASDNNLAHKLYLNIEPGKAEPARNGVKMRRTTDCTDTPSLKTQNESEIFHVGGRTTPVSSRLGSLIPRPYTPLMSSSLRYDPDLSPAPTSLRHHHHHTGSMMSLSMSGRNTPVNMKYDRHRGSSSSRRGSSSTPAEMSGLGPRSVSGISRIPVSVKQGLYSSTDCLEVGILIMLQI